MKRIVLSGALVISSLTPAFAGADTHKFNLERTAEMREERAEMRQEIAEEEREAARELRQARTASEKTEIRAELRREIREETREARRDMEDEKLFEGRASVRGEAPRGGGLPSLVQQYASKHGVPSDLAHGVVMVESRYRANATGPGGYIGLMQIGYRTAKGMGYSGSRQGLYNAETNLDYGMRYLGEAYRQAGGDYCRAVSKYQGGHGVRGITRAGAAYCGKVKKYMAQQAPAANREFALRESGRS